jgi:hypothetical protein
MRIVRVYFQVALLTTVGLVVTQNLLLGVYRELVMVQIQFMFHAVDVYVFPSHVLIVSVLLFYNPAEFIFVHMARIVIVPAGR